MKQIWNVEFKKNKLKIMVINLEYVKVKHKSSLLELLQKHEYNFDGTLGK